MQNTGLKPEEINKIQQVFAKHAAVDAVILFGSRAKGNYKASSDIDLAILGHIDNNNITDINIELDNLLLPQMMDILIYDKISNIELKEHIDRVGITLYSKK